MSEICDAPLKAGFGVGIQISVMDGEGKQLSATGHDIYGLDNENADKGAEEIFERIKVLIHEWQELKKKRGKQETPKRR